MINNDYNQVPQTTKALMKLNLIDYNSMLSTISTPNFDDINELFKYIVSYMFNDCIKESEYKMTVIVSRNIYNKFYNHLKSELTNDGDILQMYLTNIIVDDELDNDTAIAVKNIK